MTSARAPGLTNITSGLCNTTRSEEILPEKSLVLVADNLLGEQDFPEDVAVSSKQLFRGVIIATNRSVTVTTEAALLPLKYNLAPFIQRRTEVGRGYWANVLRRPPTSGQPTSGPPTSDPSAVELPADASRIELAAAFLDPTELAAGPVDDSRWTVPSRDTFGDHRLVELAAGPVDPHTTVTQGKDSTVSRGKTKLGDMFSKLRGKR